MAKRTAISASLAGKLFAGLVFLRVVGSRFIREVVLHDFFFGGPERVIQKWQ